jgi:hypothetical protein
MGRRGGAWDFDSHMMSLLRLFREISFRAKRSEHLASIVIELTVLDATTGNHDHIEGFCEIMTDSPEEFAQAALYLVPNRCSLLYLRCDGYCEAALCRFRGNYE